jgi:hypothetical protein
VSGAELAISNRSLRRIHQRASHAYLCQKALRSPPPLVRSSRRLDAVIVPASRPASALQPTIELAAWLDIPLVVLCSKQTKIEQVAQRVSKIPRAKTLVVSIPDEWKHPMFPARTSAESFQRASSNRASDLSAKRNLGLLLARLHGWNKIAFLDDDIRLSTSRSIGRLAAQLDMNQVAGMFVREHPDNSVVCHARRLAGFQQDVFVTGAVLGVHCNSLPLSFFPDIYNEDWFFFAKEAATRKLPRVGNARQTQYDPFANPDRARREEFGDLLAEGLYALFGEQDPSTPFHEQLDAATRTYWLRFIDARREVISEAKMILYGSLNRHGNNEHVAAALESLSAAASQLDTISADLCLNFLDAWRDDLSDWQKLSTGVNNVGDTRDAMDFLQLGTWTRAEFGAAGIDSETGALNLRIQ